MLRRRCVTGAKANRLRSVETRIVFTAGNQSPRRVDPALLKALARARVWFDELAAGRVRSLAEIARREGIARGYVERLARLAFVAPAIVEAICQGQQPAELSAETLLNRINLPLEWDAAGARTRHQVEPRCFDQVPGRSRGTQQPADLSGFLAFIVCGDASSKMRRRCQQARKRTDFVWRGEDSRQNCRIPLRSSLSGALRMENPRPFARSFGLLQIVC